MVAAIAALAVGCSSPPVGSCTTPAQGGGSICVDFLAGCTETDAMNGCPTSMMSTYSAEACTSANRVGRCTIVNGPLARRIGFYAPLTAQDAMSTCTASHGTYEAN